MSKGGQRGGCYPTPCPTKGVLVRTRFRPKRVFLQYSHQFHRWQPCTFSCNYAKQSRVRGELRELLAMAGCCLLTRRSCVEGGGGGRRNASKGSLLTKLSRGLFGFRLQFLSSRYLTPNVSDDISSFKCDSTIFNTIKRRDCGRRVWSKVRFCICSCRELV